MKAGQLKETGKEGKDLPLECTTQGGPKRRLSAYQLVSMKMLHIGPLTHSSVSPSQRSDTSVDSSDSSSDGIPTKPVTLSTARNLLRLLKPSPPPPTPQPRIETILSPELPEMITPLLTAHGLPPHSGFIDPSFSIYLPPGSSPATAPEYAICFKLCHGVAAMYGDPLCDSDRVGAVFDSFCAYAKSRKWRVTVIGATSRLVDHAVKLRDWGAMEFAVTSVLNPSTHVIDGVKTIRRYNRRLASAGWKVEVYDPNSVSLGRSLALEEELRELYKEWREERNAQGVPQTYSTVLEPWLVPGACRHLYVRDPDTGKVAGLATMICCGGVDGYLLDPHLAVTGSPRGVTEMLTTHALRLLKDEGATYLTFGFAPLMSINSVLNVPPLIEKPSRLCYARMQQQLGLGGKKFWQDKWRPERSEGHWLLFPPGGVTGYVAVSWALCGVSHIRLWDLIGRSGVKDSGSEGPESRDDEPEVRESSTSCTGRASRNCYGPILRTLRSVHSLGESFRMPYGESSGRITTEKVHLGENGESHLLTYRNSHPDSNSHSVASGEAHLVANGESHPSVNGESKARITNPSLVLHLGTTGQ